MTKPRDPASVEQAILFCLRTLGPEVARVTGRSRRYLQMCSDPDGETRRHLTMRDAVLLDAAMRAAGHGQPILDAYVLALSAAPSGRAGTSPQKAILDVPVAVGVLVQSVVDALEDGEIDLHERRHIASAGHAAIAKIKAALDTVEPAVTRGS